MFARRRQIVRIQAPIEEDIHQQLVIGWVVGLEAVFDDDEAALGQPRSEGQEAVSICFMVEYGAQQYGSVAPPRVHRFELLHRNKRAMLTMVGTGTGRALRECDDDPAGPERVANSAGSAQQVQNRSVDVWCDPSSERGGAGGTQLGVPSSPNAGAAQVGRQLFQPCIIALEKFPDGSFDEQLRSGACDLQVCLQEVSDTIAESIDSDVRGHRPGTTVARLATTASRPLTTSARRS